MKLSELEKGKRAIINQINLKKDVRERFISMGLCIGATIKVCRKTIKQDSLHVTLDCSACLALSRDEADFIDVTPLKDEGFGFKRRLGLNKKDECCKF
ncbi:MAG: FeoA family protein [Sulfurospirillaceae bacterium]|nr:FeoA family protein [Sulfurospirillaceae bacterium]